MLPPSRATGPPKGTGRIAIHLVLPVREKDPLNNSGMQVIPYYRNRGTPQRRGRRLAGDLKKRCFILFYFIF